MITSFIITFREILEISLIIGIILSYLIKTNQEEHNNVVYVAIASAVLASIIGAYLFESLAGGFEGTAEQIFEGISMIIASFMLTFMILWMLKQKHIAIDLHNKIDKVIIKKHKTGLFFLVFISILREGIELVLFLGAASFLSAENNLFGAMAGMVVAALFGYFIYVLGKRINLKIFFNVTSVLLILFAAGMLMRSIGEFQEAGVLPNPIDHVWDLNPNLNEDGSYPLFHEKGYIGSIAKGLVGYSASPSLLQVIAYILYLIVIFMLYRNIEKLHKVI